jgi:hypothetical protein
MAQPWLGSARLGSARLGPATCVARPHSYTSHPSAPCLSQHSAVMLTRLWPARIPHRAVSRPIQSRHDPARPARRALFAHVSSNVLRAGRTLVQHNGPHSGPPYRPGPTRPGKQARSLTHVYVCSLMCAFAQTMFSHYGLRQPP